MTMTPIFYILFIFLSLTTCTCGNKECCDTSKAKELIEKINSSIREAEKINKTLLEDIKNSDLAQWYKEVKDANIEQEIDNLQAAYNDLHYHFNKSEELLEKLNRGWKENIPTEIDVHVKDIGDKIAQCKEKLDILNNKVSNKSDTAEIIQKEDKLQDVTIRTQETRYPDFAKRVSKLEERSNGTETKMQDYKNKCEELISKANINKLENKRMMLEVKTMTMKNKMMEEMIQQLEKDIRAARERGISSLGPVDHIIATDRATAKGKKIHISVTT